MTLALAGQYNVQMGGLAWQSANLTFTLPNGTNIEYSPTYVVYEDNYLLVTEAGANQFGTVGPINGTIIASTAINSKN